MISIHLGTVKLGVEVAFTQETPHQTTNYYTCTEVIKMMCPGQLCPF